MSRTRGHAPPDDESPGGAGDPEQETPSARGVWSGTIGFGLVSIPVQLFPAVRPRMVSLRMVGPTGTPLHRRYYEPETGKTLDAGELVRGYELSRGELVVVEDEDLEKIAVDKSRDIELRQFVDASRIDPMYFERAYFLVPTGSSTKAYRLLAAVMESTKRAGLATFVMREKEYPIAVFAEKGILRAETLRFADELRTPEQAGLPGKQEPEPADVRRLVAEIHELEAPSLKRSNLRDAQAERLVRLAEQKMKRGEGVVRIPEEAQPEAANVIDLLAALKRSLGGGTSEAQVGAPGSEKRARSPPPPRSARSSASARGKSRAGARATRRARTRPRAAD